MGKKQSTKKEEVRGIGERLNRGVVKSEIVKCILKESAAVSEPDIRKYLEKTCNVQFASGIKLHLKQLQEDKFDYKCIQKIPCKNGFANSWDIKTIEQLVNIKTHFKDINLSEYPKSLDIVVEKYRRDFLPLEIVALRAQLQSPSFFEACLYTSPEIIYKQVMKNFRNSKAGLELTADVKKDINKILILYLERHPDTKISDEIFLEMSGKKSRIILAEVVDYLSEENVINFMDEIYNTFNFFQIEYFWSFSLISENHIMNDISTRTLSTEKLESLFTAKKSLVLFRRELESELDQSILSSNRNILNNSKFSNYLELLLEISKVFTEDTNHEFYRALSNECEKNMEFANECDEVFKESDKLVKELSKSKTTSEEFKVKLKDIVYSHHLKLIKCLKNLLLD